MNTEWLWAGAFVLRRRRDTVHLRCFAHREYARERIAQFAARLPVFGNPTSARPRAVRPGRAGRGPVEYRPVALGERLGPLFATYWLRATAWCRSGGPSTRRPVARLRRRGDAVARRRAGPRRSAPGRAAGRRRRSVPRAEGGERVVRARARLQRPVRLRRGGPGAGVRVRAARAASSRRFDAGRVADVPRPRVPARAGARAGRRARLGGRAARRAARVHARRRPRPAGRAARRRSGALHRVVARSATPTSTPRGCGRSRRPSASSCARRPRSCGCSTTYPEHVFAHSQAQHYAWLRERAPGAVRARARGGRARAAGSRSAGPGSSPTATCPRGESLARQFLYGQRFFERELGRRCTELWQPDVFGYTAPAPAAHARGRASTRFLTQKLSWNRFTQPEHHTFTWQGLDGSEVLDALPARRHLQRRGDRRRAARRRAALQGPRPLAPLAAGLRPRRRRRRADRARCSSGCARARDLAGLPRTTLRSPDRVLRRPRGRRDATCGRSSASSTSSCTAAPTRRRRGQARQPARRGRAARRRAARRAGRRRVSARASSTRLWETLLLNQFHDILPGSSITRGQRARPGRPGARSRPAPTRSARARARPPGDVPVQHAAVRARARWSSPTASRRWSTCPPCGAGAIVAEPARRARRAERDDGAVVLDNEHLRAVLAPDGAVASASSTWRRAARRSRRPPTGFELYEDDPTAWDAWDVDPAHLETRADVPPAGGVAAVSERPAARRGRLRARLRARRADDPARRRRAAARVPHRGRLARVTTGC